MHERKAGTTDASVEAARITLPVGLSVPTTSIMGLRQYHLPSGPTQEDCCTITERTANSYSDMLRRARPNPEDTPISRAALAAPIAVRPDRDLLRRAARASRFSPPCEGRALLLSPCGCSARLFHGLASPTWFFLRVRYVPPWRSLPIFRQMTAAYDYSVAPRRPTPRTPSCRASSDSTPFVRERTPCPNPLLAIKDTACRIDSIEAGSLPSSGADSPSSSHRMFGFRAGARFRFLACMPLINAVLFMAISPRVTRMRHPTADALIAWHRGFRAVPRSFLLKTGQSVDRHTRRRDDNDSRKNRRRGEGARRAARS